jgi:hypothetical protein
MLFALSSAPSALRFSALLLVAVAGADSASAQIGKLVLPSSIGDDPRSVHYVGTGHVVISNQVDAHQHFVDVSTPTAPSLTTSLNPPYGDQWFEAEYSSGFGGRLFTAHRGGGLNVLDVSNPFAPSVLCSVPPSSGAGYHFRGMRYRGGGANGVLYQNQTNQGLQVWSVGGGGTSMTPVWNNFSANDDGNGLELLGNHLLQFGKPPAGATRELKIFDVTVPTNPGAAIFNGYWWNQSSSHTLLRKSGVIGSKRVIATRWTDGLDVIDATVPSGPLVLPLIPGNWIPGITVLFWGAYAIPNSSLVMTYGHIYPTSNPSQRWYFWWFWDVPATGAATPQLFVNLPFETHDVSADPNTGRIYMVGINPSTTRGELWVY